MKTILKVATILLITCAMIMSGCLGTYDASSSDYGSSGPVDGAGKAVIIEHDMTICKYNAYRTVEGVIANTGKDAIMWVVVKATFYDANGNVLGESDRRVSELYRGDKKSFSMAYMGTYPNNIASYDVVIVRYMPLD